MIRATRVNLHIHLYNTATSFYSNKINYNKLLFLNIRVHCNCNFIDLNVTKKIIFSQDKF